MEDWVTFLVVHGAAVLFLVVTFLAAGAVFLVAVAFLAGALAAVFFTAGALAAVDREAAADLTGVALVAVVLADAAFFVTFGTFLAPET